MIIAIDGPAGSGKGTITKLVAKKLGLVNIDTGAMYRCIALASLRNNFSIDEEDKIINLAKKVKIEFDEDRNVYLDGENVSHEIRTKEVSDIVSQVANIIPVREELVKLQRKLSEGVNVIMEGRDITTVVFPNADYKFYLDATVEERAKRRFLQNQEDGIESSLEEIRENIEKRDYNDFHKEVGALRRSDEQIYIDSTNMTIDEVVDFIVKTVRGEV